MLMCLQPEFTERKVLLVIDVYDEGERLAEFLFKERISIKHIRDLAIAAERRDPKRLEMLIKSKAKQPDKWRRTIPRLLDILQRCGNDTEKFKQVMINTVMVYPYVKYFKLRSWR